MRRVFAIGLCALAALAAAIALWSYRGGTIGGDTAKVDKPGREEELVRMPPNTGEETRRYLRVDGKERQLEIVFQDGCTGLRKTNENGQITELSEKHKDGTSVVYTLSDKGAPQAVSFYRKNGTLYCKEVVTGATDGTRTYYQEDGVTLRARLTVSAGGQTFTTYDALGHKRFDLVEEVEAPEDIDGGRFQPPREFTRILVYNGATTPIYRQTWSPPWQDFEGGRFGGGRRFNGRPDELKLDQVEEFNEGSWQVGRRITPGKSLWIGFTFSTVTEVAVLGADGKERLVRTLDQDMRIIRMVDKTKNPEVTTDVEPASAAKEEIDATRLKSPETDADKKLKAEAEAGPTDAHLARLLVP